MAESLGSCPSCKASAPAGATECLHCGLIFSKWVERQAARSTVLPSPEPLIITTKRRFNPKILVVGAACVLVVFWMASRRKEAPAPEPAASAPASAPNGLEAARAAMEDRSQANRKAREKYDSMTPSDRMKEWDIYFAHPMKIGTSMTYISKGKDPVAWAEGYLSKIIEDQDTFYALIALYDIAQFSPGPYTASNKSRAVEMAVRYGNVEMLKAFIDKGWPISEALLSKAADGGLPDVAKILLQRGARPYIGILTASNEFFAREMIPEIASTLEGIDATGRTHLLEAAEKKRPDVVAAILDQNSFNIDNQDLRKTNALYWACKRGSVEIVTNLLKHGANPDIVGPQNRTAIMEAVMAEPPVAPELIQALIDHKADLYHKDDHGYTVFKMAKVMNREKLIPLFAAVYAPE